MLNAIDTNKQTVRPTTAIGEVLEHLADRRLPTTGQTEFTFPDFSRPDEKATESRTRAQS